MKTVKIGIVGIGSISGIYLENITKRFREIEIVGVCDLIHERAEQAAEQYSIPKRYDTMYDLFADPDVEVVLNLTRPYQHFDVSRAALEAGKHVYTEKPLASTLDEGKALVSLAKEKGLLLGGAPDTFMGGGIQTCRKIIDSGFIGEPIGAAAFLICHGHESWHPDPDFYYQHGGGPMMDMGPYYLTAMINLIGGVSGVTGICKKSFSQRLITSRSHFGTAIDVNVSTHVAGTLQFECGAVGTILTTFDVYHDQNTRLEIYGTKGTLVVPDPNGFGGPIRLMCTEENAFKEMPLMFQYADNSRSLGLADMAKAIQTGRDYRANANQIFHVLEIMESIQKSSDEKRMIMLESLYKRGLPMACGLPDGALE